MLRKYSWVWFITTLLFFSSLALRAEAIPPKEELKSKINNHNDQIKKLEEEINQYQEVIKTTIEEKDSLKKAIILVDTSRRKLSAEIKITENKISATELTLEELSSEIEKKEERIKKSKQSLAEAARSLRQETSETWVEAMLGNASLAAWWNREININQYTDRIENHRVSLEELKSDLLVDEVRVSAEKGKLSSLKSRLADEKYLVDREKKSKDKLLTETQNKEANYKKQLNERLARKEALERELFEYESQLKIAIDESLLPALGTKALNWPLDKVFITQHFGVTVDSKRLYASGSHNGIDLRAPVGTAVKAAASGIVLGSGDTDPVCPGASYGKWVLLQHDNGLSTVYGHLSLVKAKTGERVTVGDLIAYSGSTGYSTGPHLHLSVFASQGVKISSIKSKVCSGTYIVPVADPKAYLNPENYL